MSATAAGTRERLLLAARTVVEESGYRAASVLAIAERAGVAAGTMYRHFPSKEDLFVELFRTVSGRELHALENAAAAAGAGGAGPIDRLVTVLSVFARRALRNPRLAWALLAEPVDPLVDAERLAYRARYTELCAELLREAVALGEVPAQEVGLTAAALVGGVGEALVGPLSPVGRKPAAEQIVSALGVFARRAAGAGTGSAAPGEGRPGGRTRGVGGAP